jgi:hypothetical protein
MGLTPLGLIHTALGLVAVVAGFIALASDGEISNRNSPGRVFFWGTVLTCLTAFGIFRHGGFGVPHVFAIVTLVVLGIALTGERAALFGRLSPYVATVGYSLAFFLHFIPATVETPKAQPILGFFFVIFLVGAILQVLRLRARLRQAAN